MGMLKDQSAHCLGNLSSIQNLPTIFSREVQVGDAKGPESITKIEKENWQLVLADHQLKTTPLMEMKMTIVVSRACLE